MSNNPFGWTEEEILWDGPTLPQWSARRTIPVARRVVTRDAYRRLVDAHVALVDDDVFREWWHTNVVWVQSRVEDTHTAVVQSAPHQHYDVAAQSLVREARGRMSHVNKQSRDRARHYVAPARPQAVLDRDERDDDGID